MKSKVGMVSLFNNFLSGQALPVYCVAFLWCDLVVQYGSLNSWNHAFILPSSIKAENREEGAVGQHGHLFSYVYDHSLDTQVGAVQLGEKLGDNSQLFGKQLEVTA